MKTSELTTAQVTTLIGILKTEEVTLKDIIEEEPLTILILIKQ